MDPIFIFVLLVFALIGAPLFAIFGGASLLLFSQEGTITSVAVDVFSERFADSPTLVTLPLFTFAGYLMAESGTPRRLVRVSRALFGWMPGGLAIVCLVASAFFTTFTGGSGITIVAIGGLLFPALLQERYSERFSLGLVTTGGSLGLLFPPSIPIVLYGVVAGILIDKLFLAGIIPGAITVLLLAVYSAYVSRKEVEYDLSAASRLGRFALGALAGAVGGLVVALGLGLIFPNADAEGGFFAHHLNGPMAGLCMSVFGYVGGAFFSEGEARDALMDALWEVLLPVVLILGLATGILRIHEAAAFTALYVLVIEVFVYKDISLTDDLPRVIKESMTMLGAILAILATALGFTGYLIDAQVPEQMVIWMESFITSPVMFLLALNIFLLVVGMLMDIFSAIVVVVPLIVPIARHFGIDPYHLGIVFLLNLEIGYLTPPVGLNLFIASFRFDKPVTKLYTAVLPYIGLLVVALILTTYVPILSTWLPNLLVDTQEISADEIENMDDDLDAPGGGVSLDDLGDESLDDLGGDTLDDLGDEESLDDFEDLDDLDEPGIPAEQDATNESDAEELPSPTNDDEVTESDSNGTQSDAVESDGTESDLDPLTDNGELP